MCDLTKFYALAIDEKRVWHVVWVEELCLLKNETCIPNIIHHDTVAPRLRKGRIIGTDKIRYWSPQNTYNELSKALERRDKLK